eukprot:NODE_493_length_1526_cov_370.905506.p1 GENE.NODE_493_length_1526_cov_370.905506~~NODE_493_length_1526_cov_370.905506.p1  ORF type:complete len:455 (-),score=109.28 NODE_493_length_1526_cov_370.905506:125-1489(-)
MSLYPAWRSRATLRAPKPRLPDMWSPGPMPAAMPEQGQRSENDSAPYTASSSFVGTGNSLPSCLADLRLRRVLGSGFFGKVYYATEAEDSTREFALKKVQLQLIHEQRLFDQLLREIRILYSLKHPHIVQLYFDFSEREAMYLGMYYAAAGTMFAKLKRERKFPLPLAARYFHETCTALDYLHHLPEKVIHRDIKPENILISKEDSVLLADFGWANLIKGGRRETFCGTLDYLPPEMIQGCGHDESADMWCMGVLLYEMTIGRSPFGAKSKEVTCRNIISVSPHFPKDFDADAQKLILALLQRNPRHRPPVRVVMGREFLVWHFTGNGKQTTLGVEEEVGRPSVVLRSFWKEREQMDLQMGALLRAKLDLEASLQRLRAELAEATEALSETQRRRQEAETTVNKLKAAAEPRVQLLEELRQYGAAVKSPTRRCNRGLTGLLMRRPILAARFHTA